MKLTQKIRQVYRQNIFLVWGLMVILFTLVYANWDKLNSMVVLPTMSAWTYGGAGVTVGFIIMGVCIAIGIAMIASGILAPAGILILLGGVVWGGKVAGISILMGMIMDFFHKYRFALLIVGGILIFMWLFRSKHTYSYGGGSSDSSIYRRTKKGWEKL